MAKKNIKNASLSDLRAMRERGELHHNSAAPVGANPGPGFWATAEVVNPAGKKSIHLRVDSDVLEFFKSSGKGHLTRMNAVLRRYMEAHVRPR